MAVTCCFYVIKYYDLMSRIILIHYVTLRKPAPLSDILNIMLVSYYIH